jgi:hypothetical protein
MNQMRIVPEPEMNERFTELRRKLRGRHERAPGGAAGKTRRRSRGDARSRGGP